MHFRFRLKFQPKEFLGIYTCIAAIQKVHFDGVQWLQKGYPVFLDLANLDKTVKRGIRAVAKRVLSQCECVLKVQAFL